MAETKLVAWIFYIVGVPIYIWSMLLNIETWKGDVLFVLGLCLLGLKGYHDIRRNNREERKARQEERLREIEINEHGKK